VRYAPWVLLAALTLGAATASASGAQEFQVVVHSGVRGTWISRASLSALFTRKSLAWGDKVAAKPVDQSAKTPVRHAFTVSVLGLSMGAIQSYWQGRVAAERVFPPPVMVSDEEVLSFVAATVGAVGYVGPDTAIPEGVKIISIID
jgi:hypothetical protein